MIPSLKIHDRDFSFTRSDQATAVNIACQTARAPAGLQLNNKNLPLVTTWKNIESIEQISTLDIMDVSARLDELKWTHRFPRIWPETKRRDKLSTYYGDISQDLPRLWLSVVFA